MRYLFLLIVLCLGAYCVFHVFVKGPADAAKANAAPQFAMPDPVAYKLKVFKANQPEVIEVYLLHADRWRLERREIDVPGTRVTVFDGTRFVSTDPDVTNTVGPGPGLRNAISLINGMKPASSGLQDGHQCWLFKVPLDQTGTPWDLWIDQETYFPVFANGLSSGSYVEEHFQRLKSDFNILEKTCFDTSSTPVPMLAPFLTP